MNAGNRTVEVCLGELPRSVEALQKLPQAALQTPFDTAALTVAALCRYPEDREAALAMLQYLSGPRQLSVMERQFLADRFRDADYVPRSYLRGSLPQNDYTPSTPCVVEVSENPYSYANSGYAKLYLRSGGADSPRGVTLRLAKDGRWYLWEQFLLAGIRPPESGNPWT